jgi:hypothetical protein
MNRSEDNATADGATPTASSPTAASAGLEKLYALREEVRRRPLVDRLQQCTEMVGRLCSEKRPPLMSVPVQAEDEDVVLSVTLEDCAALYVGWTRARQLLREWVEKQGEDACWYYPDLFRSLARWLGMAALEQSPEANTAPPRAVFEQGCRRYQYELYAAPAQAAAPGELLPCPFCGGAGVPVKQRWSQRDFYGVKCGGDCATFFDCRSSTAEDATISWNTRANL